MQLAWHTRFGLSARLICFAYLVRLHVVLFAWFCLLDSVCLVLAWCLPDGVSDARIAELEPLKVLLRF